MSQHFNKRIWVGLVAVLAASISVAAVMHFRVGSMRYKSAPTSVDYVIASAGDTVDGIGLFTLKVKFGDDAVAANTFNLYEIDAKSSQTNLVIGPQVFTNSYVYAPSPIYFEAGNTLRFSNTVAGADIVFAFEQY